jgi:hypothetical protein
MIFGCLLIKEGFTKNWIDKPSLNFPYACTLYISPDTINGYQIGDTFTVEIRVANVLNLFAYEVKVRWNGPDTSVLKVKDIIEGPFLRQGGYSTYFLYRITYPSIYILDSRLGNVPGASGSGVLAYIKFQVKDTVATPLNTYSDRFLDPSQADIPHERVDGIVKYSIPPQPPMDTIWTRRYHRYSYYGQDRLIKIAKSSGSLYLLGDNEAGYSSNKGVLLKYSFFGNLLWEVSISYAPADMLVESNGDIYLLGTTWNEYPNAYYNIRLEHYSSSGNLIWRQSYGGMNVSEIAQKFVEDGEGNLIIVGQKGDDYLILKYSSAGQLVWDKIYNIDNVDSPVDVKTDSAGDIYVTGRGSSQDYVVMKLSSSSGDTVWTRRFNGAADSTDIPVAIVLDNEGNPTVTGYTYTNSSGYDILTIKYSSVTGDTIWTRNYNGIGNGDDYATAITIDSLGNIYIIGNSAGINTGQDWVLLKYSNDGDLLWEKNYSGWAYDSPTCMVLENAGTIFVGGGSYGERSGYDYFVANFSADDGGLLWSSGYNDSSNGYDCIGSMFLNGDTLYTAGTSYGDAYTGMDFLVIKYHPVPIGIKEGEKLKVKSERLKLEIYPNPFRDAVSIKFQIPEQGVASSQKSVVSIKIYDATGRVVRQFNHLTNYSFNQVVWDGTDDSGRRLPAGIYFVRVESDEFKETEKVILLR